MQRLAVGRPQGRVLRSAPQQQQQQQGRCRGMLLVSRSVEARQSVDPLASQPRPTVYTPGKVYTLHSPQELDQMVADRQSQLLVLMCKASHCKPCKRFAPTYSRMAELLPDSVLLDITGAAGRQRR